MSLRHSSKSRRVLPLDFVTAPMSLDGGQPNVARCLAVSLAGTLYLHFLGGLLSPNGILPHAVFTLRPSLVFSYIGSVTAQHSSSERQPNSAACDKEDNYGTLVARLRHLYSTGRPSRWVSAHILVDSSSSST